MLDGIKINYQSSIRIDKDAIIYMDPFHIDNNLNDADYIFITHSHYDHFSPDNIKKVKNDNSKIIAPKDLENDIKDLGFTGDNILLVEPNRKYNFGIKFETTYAYNINKPFHPKENNWVGYILNINNTRYYDAGDTDVLDENLNINCDVAFVPVGGYYTMDYKDASNFINIIKPKIAVPIHYGCIVGEKDYGEKFIKLLNKDIKGKILMDI